VLPSTVPCGARTFLTLFPGRDRLADLGATPMITHRRWLSRSVGLVITHMSHLLRETGVER
jgi:hypothetical protein